MHSKVAQITLSNCALSCVPHEMTRAKTKSQPSWDDIRGRLELFTNYVT